MENDEFQMIQSLIVGAGSMLPKFTQEQIALSILTLLSECPDFEKFERLVLQFMKDFPDDDPSAIIAFGVFRASMILFAGVLAEVGMKSGRDLGGMIGVLFTMEDKVLKKFFEEFDYGLPEHIVDSIGELYQ